jgi:hypothetical protein
MPAIGLSSTKRLTTYLKNEQTRVALFLPVIFGRIFAGNKKGKKVKHK